MKKVLFACWTFLVNVFESAFVTPIALDGPIHGKMAKIKFSMIVSDMRNKLNGSVFSKNRAGSYVRNKVTPVNPQTSFQTAVRGALTAASQSWRTLTQAQRDAWNTAVQNFTKTDIFGDIKTPSGINLYNALYLNANTISAVPLTSPPPLSSSPEVPDVALTADSAPQTFTITSSLGAVPAGADWVVFATSNQSAGREFVKNQYRVITVLAGGTALPYAGIADYTAKFGALVAGAKVGMMVKAIDNTTFVAGPSTSVLEVVL